jgi:hypothetical protein
MEIAQYIGVIQLTLKVGISHYKRHLVEVHFLFQCPQCNLLRNEYDIPFINIYHFNKINDFINPALIHEVFIHCI